MFCNQYICPGLHLQEREAKICIFYRNLLYCSEMKPLAILLIWLGGIFAIYTNWKGRIWRLRQNNPTGEDNGMQADRRQQAQAGRPCLRHLKHAKKRALPVGRTIFLAVLVCLAATSFVLALNSERVADYLQALPGVVPTSGTTFAGTDLTTAAGNTGTSTSSSSVSRPAAVGGLLGATVRADDAYLEDTVFVGDSRVNGMLYAGVIEEKNVFAYNGLSHSGALTKQFVDLGTGRKLTVAQAIGVRRPQRAVVAFGINGIAWIGEASFIEGYEELLDAMVEQSPDTTFIIQSILPVSTAKEQEDGRFANEKIDRYNRLLQQLAEEKGMYYLNTAEALKNVDGALDARYDRGDGLHFSNAASDAIIDYFMTHAVPG